MAYDIHIERTDGQEIGIEEWKRAVQSTDGIRLATNSISIENPTTGQRIGIVSGPGDAEICDPESEQWLPCIRFSRGRGSFRATAEFDDDTSPLRQVARALSEKLDAQVVGDECEVYS